MEKLDIHPRISVNSISTINWTLDQQLAFCKESGLEQFNVMFSHLPPPVEAGIEAVLAANVRPNILSTSGGSLIQSGEKTLENLKPSIDAAKALGCIGTYTVSGPVSGRMTTDDAYDRLVECLKPANAYAQSQGVRLGIEHTSPATRHHGFVHTLADAIELSRDAGTGIALELQNCWYERHLAELFRDHVDSFIVVQVSDFVVGEEIKFNRAVPGDGDIPLEWLLLQVLEAGYDGLFDIELLGPRIEREGYASAISRSVNWLAERLRSWGV